MDGSERIIAVVCDMTNAPDTGRQRLAEYHRLFGQALLGRERIGAAVRFRFSADSGIEEWVRDLAAREKACCPFFTFAVSVRDGEVQWDASVGDDEVARAVLDEFYALPDIAENDVRGLEERFGAREPQVSS